MDGRLSNPSLGTRSNKAVGSHIETRTLIPFRHRRSNMAPAINRKPFILIPSILFPLSYCIIITRFLLHTHTHFSLLLKRYKRIPSGLFFEWIDVPLDVHKSVRRENSTPRNPKLNSVVACSREIRREHDVESCGRNYPSCTCLYYQRQPPTARGWWPVSLARFAPPFPSFVAIFPPSPLLLLLTYEVDRSRLIPRRELLEKAFPPRPTRFPNDRAKLNRNFST